LRQDTDLGAAWWTLQTSPHNELLVCRHLSAFGYECYAPEFAHGRRTRPGSVRDRRHHWIFPGYVFFRSPLDPGAWTAVRWVPGVVRVLEQDGAPALLADGVIRELRTRIAERELRAPGFRWRPGESVRIVRGPLAQLDAIFEQELDASERVQILVRLLGRDLSVSIDPMHLSAKVS
jgi:transcription antitermination factor NusG